jgi:microsomal dipeptidase-like Zn-dependent dipeptidase
MLVGAALVAAASASAAPTWGPQVKEHCVAEGLRQVSARLYGAPQNDGKRLCESTPRNVLGVPDRLPDRCPSPTRGEWDVHDASCRSVQPPTPVRGGTGTLSSPEPLEGFADIHVHQMGNLGFAGSIVWGDAFGPAQGVLGPIPRAYRAGHNIVETGTHGSLLKALLNIILGGLFGHGEDGWPTFESWPRWNMWTHQQVYQDWLYRAYQGGLRLMVMLALNSEDPFGRGENQLGIFGRKAVQKAKAPGRTVNDMESLEWQVRAAYLMQRSIDEQKGGPGKGWYRIVRDPDEARDVIAQGKLAVILGTELQHLFNCDIDRPACTPETIAEGLDRLEAMGVNYVFPIHLKLNQFGGPAMFLKINSGRTERCVDLRHKCGADGLTDLGRDLVRELAARGMLIDTEHFSRKSFDEAMAIVEQLRYPVLASHVVPLDLQTVKLGQNERARSSDELLRILRVGGIIASVMSTGAEEYAPGGPARVPIRCRGSNGDVDQWANAYVYFRSLTLRAGAPTRAIAFGNDWNGFAGWPGPRHSANDPCSPTHLRNGARMAMEPPIRYPFDLPESLKPAADGGTRTLQKFVWPPGQREWDYNLDGASHVGMTPDFLENVRVLGFTVADLEPLYRSARGIVDLWAAARNVDVPGVDRRHLRWAPQSAFDVMDFDMWDHSRNVVAEPGYPICRTARGRALGFLRDGACRPVEGVDLQPASVGADEQLAVYDTGRCLDVRDNSVANGARAEQRECAGVVSPFRRTSGVPADASQFWRLTSLPGGETAIVNRHSRKCLAVDKAARTPGARAVQHACTGSPEQTWTVTRVGNTFAIAARHSGQCLEVRGQSRKNGAAIQQAACTGASNQLWTIASRRRDDFERLYQADKHRIAWLESETPQHPFVVTVDGTRPICRAPQAPRWLGVVTGARCVGRSYEGTPMEATAFERLYQSR